MNSAPPFDPKALQRRFYQRPWLWVIVGLIALLGIGLRPRPIPVEIAVVQRGALQTTVDEEGETRVRNRYVVSTPAAGNMLRVLLKPGASVSEGQVLAEMVPSASSLPDARSLDQAKAQWEAAKSSRDMMQARLKVALSEQTLSATDFKRAKQLHDKGVLSEQEFDVARQREFAANQSAGAARFQFKVAEYEVSQAEAALKVFDADNDDSPTLLPIKSPVSGVVLRVYQESSRVLPGGSPVIEIGDVRDLEVVVDVLSRDGVVISPGADMYLGAWGGSGDLEARVRLVEPSAFTKISALGVEEQRVNVVADIVTPWEARTSLGDGFRVEARIVSWSGADVLEVPSGALFQQDDKWKTFVVSDGRAVLRDVSPGHSNGHYTEILNGLNQDERVIVFPGDRVENEARVESLE